MSRHRSLYPALALGGAAILLALVWLVASSTHSGALSGPFAPPSSREGTTVPSKAEISTRSAGDGGSKDWFASRDLPPVDLAGRVFLDGQPASAVTVTLSDELTSDGLLPRQRIVTDREGRFSFPSVTRIRGWYRLAAGGGAGLAPAWATVAGDVSKTDIELRMEACRMHVYGVVSDASGGAVAAAKIFLEKVPDHGVVADNGGHFEICMAPRSGRLHVEADGYGPWLKWVSPRGALRQDVTLMPEASVAGTVVFAKGGAPVPHALVSLRVFGESFRDVQADESGHFEIPRVAPGSYAVEARSAGARSKQPVDVAVFASAKANVTVAVDERARVHGRVVSRGVPVARIGINLGFLATFEWGSAVRTGEDGSFTIDDAPIGNVFVKIDDYEVESPKTLLVSEAGLSDVTVHVASKGELAVTVTRQGAPVSDANVALRGTVASESKSTDAAGIARFRGLGDLREPVPRESRGLGESTYRVFAEHDNDFAVAERVQVGREARDATKLTLELTAGRQVAGRVVDDRGVAVDGARVSFTLTSSTEDTGASATTGSDGSFRGGPLRGPSIYRVKVTRSGFVLDPKGEFPRLTVPEHGPVTPKELVLVVKAQDKELTGIVVEGGGPVRDARVTVSRSERHSEVLATTYTGDNGAFTLRSLGAGPYAVKATAVSGSEAEVKPLVLPADPVKIELPPVGTIRGALRGFARTPSVMAWSIVGYEWDFHPAVLENGRFTISGVSRGRYHVAAASSDAAAQVTVDVDGSNPVEVDLVASSTRTIRGKTLDFLSGKPLPNMNCQAAPFIGGARSPVVVPGNVFSDQQGTFELASVPASDLYMWCTSDAAFRGGAARLPADLGDNLVTVWGLDVRGRPPLDVRTLGLTMAEDYPLSRRVAVVEPKGAAEHAGVLVGDVFEEVGEKSVAECGNGLVRNYLALLLTERRSVSIAMSRGGSVVPLVFELDARTR